MATKIPTTYINGTEVDGKRMRILNVLHNSCKFAHNIYETFSGLELMTTDTA